MTDVLVCVKRVVDSSGQVQLTDDAQSVDGRYVGFTVCDHEECAVELAVQVAAATSGTATVLTVGAEEAVEQLRSVLAVGRTAATLVEADPGARPGRRREGDRRRGRGAPRGGPTTSWCCSATTPPTPVTSRSGVRLAYALGVPVVTGAEKVEVADGTVVAPAATAPDGHEGFEVPLPGGGLGARGRRRPAVPHDPGRMEAKKVEIEQRVAGRRAAGLAWRLLAATAAPANVRVLGEGPRRRPPPSTSCRSWGGWRDDPGVRGDRRGRRGRGDLAGDDPFARDLRPPGGGVPVSALLVGECGAGSTWRASSSASDGVASCTSPAATASTSYAAAAWAVSCSRCARRRVGGGDRGRHAARQRAAGPRGRAARRADGSQRRVVPRALAAGRHPPGDGRLGLEEMLLASGRRSSASPATPSRRVAGRDAHRPVVECSPRSRLPTWLPGWSPPSRRARPLRRPQVRTRRGRRRSRRRRPRRVRRRARAGRPPRRPARCLAAS